MIIGGAVRRIPIPHAGPRRPSTAVALVLPVIPLTGLKSYNAGPGERSLSTVVVRILKLYSGPRGRVGSLRSLSSFR